MADRLAHAGSDPIVVGAEHDPDGRGGAVSMGGSLAWRQFDDSFESGMRSYIKSAVSGFERKASPCRSSTRCCIQGRPVDGVLARRYDRRPARHRGPKVSTPVDCGAHLQ